MTAGARGRLWRAVPGPFALRCASMADSGPLCARPKERAQIRAQNVRAAANYNARGGGNGGIPRRSERRPWW
jgi:hypothetical protein